MYKILNSKLYLFLILLIFSCNSNKQEQTFKIAVASNLRFAMVDINKEFEKQTGKKVEMITASSGKLTAQITNGAPFDLFISANKKYAEKIYADGFAKEKPEILCKGILVLWSNSKIETDLNTFFDNPDLKTVAIANPKNAPYGIAAVEVLKNVKLYDKIESKLIFSESVMQLNQYIIKDMVII